jgi:3-hydroxymyristoyl/3-hydroxydecanoyl-(acyl carrier protein) dehydratase
MPDRRLRMIDGIEAYDPAGGAAGLGHVRGTARVDPSAWFFKAHFHQDPVWPGSLGLESFLQLLKVAAIERWGESLGRTHGFAPLLGEPHRWTYRGQILPTNRRVTVEASVTSVEDSDAPAIRGDGLLYVDGLCIYQMQNFGIRLVPVGRT